MRNQRDPSYFFRFKYFALSLIALVIAIEMYTTFGGNIGRRFDWRAFYLLAIGTIGFVRVPHLHPALSPRYAAWLATTPWRNKLPLPLGPVHLVWPDMLLILCAELYAVLRLGFSPGAALATFLFAYSLTLSFAFLKTLQTQLYFAVTAFVLPGVLLMLPHTQAIAAVLMLLYLYCLIGQRRLLDAFPWQAKVAKRNPGWPYSRIGPMQSSTQWSVYGKLVLSLWLGLASYCVFDLSLIRAQFIGDTQNTLEAFPHIATVVACAVAVIRLAVYCAAYWPPIGIKGRVFTGRLIVPGYDHVFIAPAILLAMSLLPEGLIEVNVAPQLAASLAIGVVVALGFLLGPSLHRWKLTGQHRIINLSVLNHSPDRTKEHIDPRNAEPPMMHIGLPLWIFRRQWGNIFLVPFWLIFFSLVSYLFIASEPAPLALFALLSGFAGTFYGIIRAIFFAPEGAYKRWLATSPWTPAQPLPLGPVQFVWQDMLMLGILEAVGLHHNVPLGVPTICFGIVYAVTNGFRIRNQRILAFIVGAGIPLVLRFVPGFYWKLLGIAVVDSVAYLGVHGWIRDGMLHDWEKPKRKLLGEIKPHGAPFDLQLMQRNHWARVRRFEWYIVISIWVCTVVYGLDYLLNLFAHLTYQTISREEEFRYLLTIQIIFACAPIFRLLKYCLHYSPPIGWLSRFKNGMIIIPGYDKVFVAPLCGLFVVFFGPEAFMKHYHLRIDFAMALSVLLMLAICRFMGPSLNDWQLTGFHRIRMATPVPAKS